MRRLHSGLQHLRRQVSRSPGKRRHKRPRPQRQSTHLARRRRFRQKPAISRQRRSPVSGERPAPASAAHVVQEPAQPETTQPLRAVSLEFAPDGVSDVRLRLSERAGEVHISLHSSDPSLSGRLHEGIHDLVGSLATAGYDAEAWTPSQGRQNQRQPEDSPKRRQDQKSGSGGETFSGILQQPVREI